MNYEKMNEQKTRYHSLVRPRYLNPTFLSTNISFVMAQTLLSKPKSQATILPQITSSLPQANRNQTKAVNPQTIPTKIHSDVDQSREPTPVRSEQTSQESNYSSLRRRSMSLSDLKHTNDKLIYEKQARKYNIITIEPKKYFDSIRLFPKLRQEFKYNQEFDREVMNKQIAQKYDKFMKMVEAKTSLHKKFNAGQKSHQLSAKIVSSQ